MPVHDQIDWLVSLAYPTKAIVFWHPCLEKLDQAKRAIVVYVVNRKQIFACESKTGSGGDVNVNEDLQNDLWRETGEGCVGGDKRSALNRLDGCQVLDRVGILFLPR